MSWSELRHVFVASVMRRHVQSCKGLSGRPLWRDETSNRAMQQGGPRWLILAYFMTRQLPCLGASLPLSGSSRSDV